MLSSLDGPLSYGSPVVVFLDRGNPCCGNFYSTVPVDVVGVKSYVSRLFDPASLTMRIINSKAGAVRCCGRALKRRTSGYGRGGCLVLPCIGLSDLTAFRGNPRSHNSEVRNAPITAIENQPITAKHRAL